MGAIFYREMKAYFSSLLAWSLIAAFLAVVGFFMLLGMMQYAEISASAMQGAMPYNINTYFSLRLGHRLREVLGDDGRSGFDVGLL